MRIEKRRTCSLDSRVITLTKNKLWGGGIESYYFQSTCGLGVVTLREKKPPGILGKRGIGREGGGASSW